ncbi:MAG: hypothetical protein JO301_11485 [Chitinophagaceae bacterium]|nr:hypothetical protein [Chitinophagaceae bacterium]
MHLPKQLFRTRLLGKISMVAILIMGIACNKTTVSLSSREQTVQYLTGTGNRYWKIRELYINGVQQTLTSAQLDYWKVYTVPIGDPDAPGSFSTMDGYIGSWELTQPDQITERILNLPNGPVSYLLKILKLGTYEMDVEYTANGVVTRTVYFAN